MKNKLRNKVSLKKLAAQRAKAQMTKSEGYSEIGDIENSPLASYKGSSPGLKTGKIDPSPTSVGSRSSLKKAKVDPNSSSNSSSPSLAKPKNPQSPLKKLSSKSKSITRNEEKHLKTIDEGDEVSVQMDEIIEAMAQSYPKRHKSKNLDLFEDSDDDLEIQSPSKQPMQRIANPTGTSLAERLRIARLKKAKRDERKLKKSE